MHKNMTLLIKESVIKEVINLAEICDTVEETYRYHGLNKVVMPAKITLNINPVNHQAWMNAMPAYVEPLEAAGIKWAGGFINNPCKYNLPYVQATLILNNPVTGERLAIMDGSYISDTRTGSAASVSAKYTARKDSRIVTIIGAGVQARWTLRTLIRYFKLDEVRIVDIIPEAASNYVRELTNETGIKIVPFTSGDEAARGADIIFTMTTAEIPVVHKDSIDRGATVISLGSYQELDDDFTLSADKVIVDSTEQCLHRGELAHLVETGKFCEQDVYSELGPIVAGTKAGRESDEERILVVPIGLGSLDMAIGRKAYNRALENNAGIEFDLST